VKLFDYTVEVTTGPEAAFQVVADPRSKLLWVPGIRRVEVSSDVPPGPGMRYLASSGIWPLEFVFQEQIVGWVENERVTYEGRSPWGHFKTCVVLESEQGALVCIIGWTTRSLPVGSGRWWAMPSPG
jgi:hypothetical protein